MKQAQDTFVAEMADGSPLVVKKGDYLPNSHPLVKLDADGSGTLFKDAHLDDDDDPPAKPKAKPAAVKS